MQRSTFLKYSIISAMSISAFPYFVFGQNTAQDVYYTTDELMGKTEIPLFGKGINLQEPAYKDFTAMQKAAKADGISIQIVSSYRNFARQKSIWERKFYNYTEVENYTPIQALDAIITYSTIPGTSRHHWGTDVDIIDGNIKTKGDVLNPEKFENGGPFEALKKWMDANAATYNFHLVYTNNAKRKGFKYEPWHYSYAPISVPMLTAFRKKNILRLLQDANFEGSEHFTSGFIQKYIQDNLLDINPILL